MSSNADRVDLCGVCHGGFRDKRGKFITKTPPCVKCKKLFHPSCVQATIKDINQLTSSGRNWVCPKCARQARVSGQPSSSKSLSVTTTPGATLPSPNAMDSSQILSTLTGISQQLSEVRNSSQMMSSSIPDGALIIQKLDSLISDVGTITKIVTDYGEKLRELSDLQAEMMSENARLRTDVKSLKISMEMEKQRSFQTDLILCGLPKNQTVDDDKILENLCKKLEIQVQNYADSGNVRVTSIDIENRTKTEKNLIVASAPELCAAIDAKYREAKKEGSRSVHLIYLNLAGRVLARKDDGGAIIVLKHIDDLEQFK
ncbi:hypothetical protein DMENIID0001_106420 [Sergentomyia squamirostris]